MAAGRITRPHPLPLNAMATTRHTYPDLLTTGGRLAATDWPSGSLADAVRATLALDPEVVILRADTPAGDAVRGLAPGGLAA